jgi:hypothetical protein
LMISLVYTVFSFYRIAYFSSVHTMGRDLTKTEIK